MTLTTNDFIDYFWSIFLDILDREYTESELKGFLLQLVEYSKELYCELAEHDKIGFSINQMPLLAMISEIQLVAPAVVSDVGKENKIVSKAISLLENYNADKRMVLRKYFLKMDNIKFLINGQKN